MEILNKEEDGETKIIKFEEILHTLKASTKENIEGREHLMKLKKGVTNAEIGRSNKILTIFVL